MKILRLYVQTEDPSEKLKSLVNFIVKAYAPAVFDIVQNPGLEYGAYHYFNYVKRAKECLSAEDWDFVSKYFVINDYFAHPENVLLSMLTDEAQPELRKRAANIINTIKAQEKPDGVRLFIKPEVDWKAKSYEQLVKDVIPEVVAYQRNKRAKL